MKQFLTLIALCMIENWCLGQTDSIPTAPADSTKPKPSLTIGVVYCNNADYYGQVAEQAIQYAATAATYKMTSGIYFTGLAYRILNDSNHTVSAENIRAGIDIKLNKRFSTDISFSHSFYPGYSPLLQAANANNASASLVYDNFLATKITADYAFGKTSDLFLIAGTNKQLNLGHISHKDIITVTPSIEVNAGTQHFYQTYLTEKRLQDSLLGIILNPITGTPTSQGSSTKTETTQFNILSYSFKCPLAYYRAHYMLEFNYQISVLSNKAESGAGKSNAFYTVSFYYQF
jgi:hypothetical protein